jgi:RNA 3'-terminal phosphate cyclase (ATP)
MIILDGQTLEGGGQNLRNAIALAALTNQSLSIQSIRGSRPGRKGLEKHRISRP